jgi:hypothetical protein
VCVVLIAVLVVHVVEVGCPVEAETKRRPETSGPHTHHFRVPESRFELPVTS